MQNRLEIVRPLDPESAFLLDEECMKFLEELVSKFKGTRDDLLSRRKVLQDKLLIKPELLFPELNAFMTIFTSPDGPVISTRLS